MEQKAYSLAAKAHAKQVDKGGEPYIFHPVAVSEACHTETDKVVALLHDVIEDTSITLNDLAEQGFSEEIIEAVNAITKREGEPYDQYLERVKHNSCARRVKIADLRHNMDVRRLRVPLCEEDERRLAKYREAIAFLSEV